MKTLLFGFTFVVLFSLVSAQARDPVATQGAEPSQNAPVIQPSPSPTALSAYTKWRDESLRNFPQGLLTPHYAVAIVAQRLDDHTAQVEMLIAAEMKRYTITIRPVTLTRQPSGEYLPTPAGNAVTINQKAGRKFGTGPDRIWIGDTTTLVPVTRTTQALEITWAPKNDRADDPVNTCVVRLSREPQVMVNGYIFGAPVR